MSNQTFYPRDTVVFDPDKALDYFKRYYGEGPFEVVDMKFIPADECTCGNRHDLDWWDCPYASYSHTWPDGEEYFPYGKKRRDSVGHHQFIWIRPPDGKIQMFSGTYFVHVPGTQVHRPAMNPKKRPEFVPPNPFAVLNFVNDVLTVSDPKCLR